MSTPALRDQDLAQLAERGISPAEAERQLALLARPAGHPDLVRPCTVGDGIDQLSDANVEALQAVHWEAASRGRVTVFVPASGAATRMFRELLAVRDLPGPLMPDAMRASADPNARALVSFVHDLPRFAFAEALAAVLTKLGLRLETLRHDGPWRPLLEALLDSSGLDAARAPKGLLPFHREGGEARTAFEDHLLEACAIASDAHGTRMLDVTVSPEHRVGFERLLAERAPALARDHGGRWQVAFSDQHPSTDTLAADPAGGPFRDDRGRLLFRPAGHGALIANLAEAGRDLVFLKNIDNVAVWRLKRETERWSRALVGLAVQMGDQLHRLCRDLEEEWDDTWFVMKARKFAETELGLATDARLDAHELLAWMNRPVRVCGMVQNTGEPGGGPFWVRDAGGVSRQIVESAQVDHHSKAQQAIFRGATHFNPVFLAASLRDAAGRPHDLTRFVDESAVIITRKSYAGRDLLALERPGLWNGAMARWHTRFVEVPLAVFNPVKTVFDLLRPEHQG